MSRYVVGVLLACGMNAFVSPNVQAHFQEVVKQESPEVVLARAEGERWFKRMQVALSGLNYRASFISMQPSGVQSYRWTHSVTGAGNDIEMIEALNGPHNQAIRFNNQVTYLSSVNSPYSVTSNTLAGPIPSGLYGKYANIHQSYNVVAVGGDRIADRDAQHIRLIPHARDRYLYSLWIDRETGMLLSINTYLPSGDVVEQVLLTSIHVQQEPLNEINELETQWQAPPEAQVITAKAGPSQWQFHWLPPGFEVERQQQVRVAMNGPVAEHFLFSDGMTKFSVYISENTGQVLPVQYESLTSMVSVVHQDYAVTIVGKIPVAVAQEIAGAVRVQP